MAKSGSGFAVRVWQSSATNKWYWDILFGEWAHMGKGSGFGTEAEARKAANDRLDAIAQAAKSAKVSK